jgi:3-oxoacyl-(acyl-carrier-protein) synthase
MGERVVVTGIGPVTPVGTGVDDFHYAQLQNKYGLINGCHPVRPFTPSS